MRSSAPRRAIAEILALRALRAAGSERREATVSGRSRSASASSDPTEVFDPRTQRAVRTEPTAVEADDKRIIARVRQGYRWNGSIVRPEMVVISKYKPA